jgi:hypothetical protein
MRANTTAAAEQRGMLVYLRSKDGKYQKMGCFWMLQAKIPA